MPLEKPPARGPACLAAGIDSCFVPANSGKAISSRPAVILKTVISTAFFVFSCYVILSGLIAGNTRVFSDLPWPLLLLILAFITFWLAALEGLQISITALGLCDLDDYREARLRAWKIHKMFEGADASNKFLAGRQLQVIGLVFIAARLTSFHDFSAWPFSEATNRWARLFLLDFGFLGAFFVLWVGQLIPQFIARRNPLFFQDLPGLYALAVLTRRIESLGLTSPLIPLSRIVRETRLPLSRKERFLHEFQTHGYGALELRRTWKFRADEATLTHEKSTIFYETKKTYAFCERIGVDENFRINRRETEGVLFEGGFSNSASDDLTFTPADTDHDFLHDSPVKVINLKLSRASGFFRPNDVISVKSDFYSDSYSPENFTADLTEIVHPTRRFLVRVEFREDEYELLHATISARRKGDANIYEPTVKARLQPQKSGGSGDGRVVYVEHEEWYPEVAMVYAVEWSCRKLP